MGAINDFLASVETFDMSDQATATDRSIKSYFEWLQEVQGDPDYPAGYTAVNEVQSQAIYVPTVSGGTFRLYCDLKGREFFQTDEILYNATASAIGTAINAAVNPANERQDLAAFGGTVTSGTFTLTITLQTGETFTTAAITYNASPSAVINAINLAATTAGVENWTNGDIGVTGGDLTSAPMIFVYLGASVAQTSPLLMTIDGALLVGGTAGAVTRVITGHPLRVQGWLNGDISVSGGDLTTTPVVYTFDGDSVAGTNPGTIVVDSSELTGGGSAGAVSVTTGGQGNRSAWAVMKFINVVSDLPVQGTLSPLTVIGLRGSMHLSPNADVLRALAGQAAIDDDYSPVKEAILDGLRDNGVEV